MLLLRLIFNFKLLSTVSDWRLVEEEEEEDVDLPEDDELFDRLFDWLALVDWLICCCVELLFAVPLFTSLIVLLADMAFALAASNGLEPAGDWLLIELAIEFASELVAEPLPLAADGWLPAVAK